MRPRDQHIWDPRPLPHETETNYCETKKVVLRQRWSRDLNIPDYTHIIYHWEMTSHGCNQPTVRRDLLMWSGPWAGADNCRVGCTPFLQKFFGRFLWLGMSIFYFNLVRRFRDRAFAIAAPHMWNSLPTDIKLHQLTTTSFKRRLKTVLLNLGFAEYMYTVFQKKNIHSYYWL